MTRKRILLIDADEALVQQVAQAAAARGIDAQGIGSSTAGYDRARSERPDLIVVNVELAPATGWTLCSKLKRDEELKSTPVILTSGSAGQDDFEKHKKLRIRADEYLLKPYRPEELLRLASGLVGLEEGAEELAAEADEPLGFEMPLDDSAEPITLVGDEPLGADATADGSGIAQTASLDEEMLAADPPVFDAAEELAVSSLGGSAPASEEPVDPLGEAALLADEGGLDLFQVPPTPEELAAFDASYGPSPGESTAAGEGYGYDEASLGNDSEEAAAGPADFDETGALESEDFSEQELAAAVETAADASPVEARARFATGEAPRGNRQDDEARDDAQRREVALLREQLQEKDLELAELRERERERTQEAAKARDELEKREAAYRALVEKAKAFSQQAARLSKELSRAREELAAAGDAQARLARAEESLAAKSAELDALQGALAREKDEHELASTEVERLAAEIEGRKLAADQTASTLAALQEKLAAAEERASRHEAQALGHEETLGRTREALKGILGGLGE